MARILIVEDEPITAADLEQTLSALGHAIAGWGDTGEDAVAQADIVLILVGHEKFRGVSIPSGKRVLDTVGFLRARH